MRARPFVHVTYPVSGETGTSSHHSYSRYLKPRWGFQWNWTSPIKDRLCAEAKVTLYIYFILMMCEQKLDQWHVLKTNEQLFKDLYVIFFYEHITKHWPLTPLQAKLQLLSFKININVLVIWKTDLQLSVKYDFKTSICTMDITSSWEECRFNIIPII